MAFANPLTADGGGLVNSVPIAAGTSTTGGVFLPSSIAANGLLDVSAFSGVIVRTSGAGSVNFPYGVTLNFYDRQGNRQAFGIPPTRQVWTPNETQAYYRVIGPQLQVNVTWSGSGGGTLAVTVYGTSQSWPGTGPVDLTAPGTVLSAGGNAATAAGQLAQILNYQGRALLFAHLGGVAAYNLTIADASAVDGSGRALQYGGLGGVNPSGTAAPPVACVPVIVPALGAGGPPMIFLELSASPNDFRWSLIADPQAAGS